MMNYIWASMIVLSVFCALLTGRIEALSGAVLEGAEDAVKLIISVLGMMALWTGIMKAAEKSGITAFFSRLFSPIIKFLFPECPPGGKSANAICMNIAANLLGLGNAATPFGIKAMKEMQKQNPHSKTATNAMIMFVVVNTASLQLVPTFLCALRKQNGSANAFGILPCLWLTSFVALAAGIISAKIFEKVRKD